MTARSKRLASVPRVTAVLLAVLALGAGALVNAPMAGASVRPACIWQPLYLLNGWQAQGLYGTGDPMYCVDGAMVYLTGSLDQSAAGGQEFAVLPPQAAPASTSYFTVYTLNGTAGVLRIEPGGGMYAYGGAATWFTSLAGISFPAAQSAPAGQSLALENGWQSAQGNYGTGDPSFFVSGNITHLSGSVTNNATNPDGDFAVFPTIDGPDNCVETNVYTSGGTVGWLRIDPSLNTMTVQDEGPGGATTSAAGFTSLAGISFPSTGTPWQPLNLENNWEPVYNNQCWNGDTSYYISGRVVYLAGALAPDPYSPHGSGPVATLPLAARPAHTLYLTVNEELAPPASLEIKPDGTMYLFGGLKPTFTSLAGVSYQASS
ncbi:MAG TPA: hypothetical protein VGS19_20000 [Streptosporangiaceae bacterium]|nr:hypothetical protein [Streptosporangiaceae bacterium]